MKFLRIAVMVCFFLLFASGCAGEVVYQENQQAEMQNDQEEMNGVFRYSNWGDTIEQVETVEGTDYYTNGPELILYRDIKLLTYNTNVIYFFEDNHLNSACYEFTEGYTKDELYVKDFDNVDKELKKQYGEPDIQKEEGYSDTLKEEWYKDTPFALFIGDIKYATIWKTEMGHIVHTLSFDNKECEHVIYYINPKN